MRTLRGFLNARPTSSLVGTARRGLAAIQVIIVTTSTRGGGSGAGRKFDLRSRPTNRSRPASLRGRKTEEKRRGNLEGVRAHDIDGQPQQ